MNLDLERFGGAADQKAEFFKAMEKVLPTLRIQRNRVLVGTHVERTKTRSGLIMPSKRIEESRFQGKAGLILAIGPDAFRWEHLNGDRDPDAPKVGEWVFYRAADTWECGLGAGVPCRFVYDDSIVSTIEDPTQVW